MAKNNSFGLGRGLDVLLPSGSQTDGYRSSVQYINSAPAVQKTSDGQVCSIDITLVEPNPNQPRVTFDQTALEELCESIRSLGVVQPITVRLRAGGKYQIISGERRYRAALMAGLATIPAFVRDTDEITMLQMSIVENVQREDLDPIETAMSYQRLIDECSLTQEQMARIIGKSRVSVTNFLRLLRLPAKVQYDIKTGKLSVGHAKVLLGVEDPALQEKLSDKVARDGISVRELERQIKALSEAPLPSFGKEDGKKKETGSAAADLTDGWRSLLESFGEYYEGDISLRRSRKGAVMTIRFDNESDARQLASALKNGRKN